MGWCLTWVVRLSGWRLLVLVTGVGRYVARASVQGGSGRLVLRGRVVGHGNSMSDRFLCPGALAT